MRWSILFLIVIIGTFFFFEGYTVCKAGLFDDISLSGTFESVYWNHDPSDWDPDGSPLYEGPYTSFENILSLNVDWREWYLELRIRSMEYEDAIHYDYHSREHEVDLELFKFSLGYRGEQFSFLGGDFYKSLAHGMVLYVQEDKELNLDRTIRGGTIDFSSEILDFNIFGGQIKWYKFKDDIAELVYDTYKIDDDIAGGRIVAHLPFDMSLGIDYVWAKVYEIIRDAYESEELWTGGIDLEANGLLSGMIDFSAEYAQINWDKDQPFGEDVQDGVAFYGSLTFYLGPVTVLTEYKDYDHWNYRYSRPPTADRDDEIAETDDIRGPRLKIDYFFNKTNTLIYISASRFDNHAHPTTWGDTTRNRIDHIFGGIEQNWKRFYAHLTAGYKKYVTLNEIHRRYTSDLVYNITDANSLNLYYEYKYTGNDTARKDEHEIYLTYSFSPWIAATIHYNRHVMDYRNHPEETENWVAGEITVTPISALSINILYGELPNGLICSGGQCRIVPEFEGVQASLTYRF